MKPLRRLLFAVLVLMLAGSLGVNYFLFSLAKSYYANLHELSLNPLRVDDYPAAAPADQGKPRFVFYGDSRAAGWSPPDGFVGYDFINRGIDGHTSAQTLLRYEYHVMPLQADVLLLQVGINDLKSIPLLERRAAIIQNLQDNIRAILDRALAEDATVILTTIFPAGDVPLERLVFWSDDVRVAVQEVNTFIRAQASEKVIIMDAYAVLVDDDGKVRPEYRDGTLHINPAGYTALNDELATTMRNELTL